MTPEEILSHPARPLAERQCQFYFEAGYLVLERIIDDGWLERLRGATAEMIERSRATEASNNSFVLEPGHQADAPRLRRLNRAADHHPVFWEYASESILPDIVADLVGPDVKFRESMFNFKWAGGGDPVDWHQDLAFSPHTNRTPLITLLCLEDVTPEMAPLKVIPGSHNGELFDHHDDAGRWAGGVSARDLERAWVGKAVSLPAPAGTLNVIHSWMIHGSEPNTSDRCRPLLDLRLLSRRCLQLHAARQRQPLHLGDRARPAGQIQPPRAAAPARPARLVPRLHLDLRGPERRTRRARARQGLEPGRHPTH